MVKGFRQIAALTTLSRVLGMARDMAFAHFFGAGWLMTAWTWGFKVPNLSRRLFGEGAASASFIPIYSEQLHQDRENASRLANTILTVVFIILTALVVIGEVLVIGYYLLFEKRLGPRTGLALCAIMLPYMVFICITALLAGILNVHKHFAAPAAAPIVLNIFIIAGILITGTMLNIEPQRQVFFVAVVVLFAGVAQVGLQLVPLRATGIALRPAWQVHSESFKKIMLMMAPMIIAQTVTQLNTLADDIIATTFMNENGYPLSYSAVSYLYYSQRLYQFPLGVLGISLATAIFPVMSADAARKDYDALTETVSRGIRSAVFIAIPATAGIWLVARPLVSIIFEHGQFKSTDTPVVAFTLSFYALGLCGYFCQQIMTRAFFSLQDSKTPMKSAMFAVATNVILNLTLIWFMGTAGLALSTAICSYLQVIILTILLRKRFKSSPIHGLGTAILKAAAAVGLMCISGGAILILTDKLPQNHKTALLQLALIVPLSALVYLLAAKILRIEELSLLIGASAKKQGPHDKS